MDANESKSEQLNRETQAIWDANAEWWDEYGGEAGPITQVKLLGPGSERLLDLKGGELVLDVGCGNGHFARRMARLGANVVAFDFSEKFLARARERSVEFGNRIEYRLVDATSEEQLLSLGERRFDAAVSTMVLMDMANIDPLISTLPRLLKPGGRFVFSVTHPCFNSGTIKKVIEEEDRDGEIITVYSIKVSEYATPLTHKGLGIIGQPAPQYYFHRPLNVLLNTCFKAGFVMDGIEEPVFREEGLANRPFSWANFRDIPIVFIARMKLPE